jgi:uncharacterized protein (TIGR00255 family)
MYSMTGFARAVRDLSLNETDDFQLICEIKSVNSRYLDCLIKIPREYISIEGELRRIVGESVRRGRVEVSLSIGNSASKSAILISDKARYLRFMELALSLLEQQGFKSKDIKERLALEIALRKDIIYEGSVDSVAINPKVILSLVKEGVEQLRGSQKNEGKALASDILGNLDSAASLITQIKQQFIDIQPEYFSTIKSRISSMLAGEGSLPEERLIVEAAIMADRADISEELSRLNSHIEQFRQISTIPSCGRKLDFLLQEFLREANTISSKIQRAELQHLVVELKTAIERMKEQVQNVE